MIKCNECGGHKYENGEIPAASDYDDLCECKIIYRDIVASMLGIKETK